MSSVPTMPVLARKTGVELIINVDDFDPLLYMKPEEVLPVHVDEPPKAKPMKRRPLVERE